MPLEYDVIVEVKKEKIHLLGFLVEAWDHLANVRHADLEDAVRLVVPADFLQEVLELLESICDYVGAKVREVRPFEFPL
ncbi:MAG: hypothetical protein PWP37_951 [Thermotogota bacterium]|nr:hypothetical protein [Thermotogota bacterium]MDK2864759.1 hypothetical protein [Thermotogota bacterium]HCZ07481.1 DUF4911 domain-containing protein [Thermotogota bacterium]